jgi:outer membrane protein assembly factor BamB
VKIGRTTICCSALTLACLSALSARTSLPLSFMPVQTAWTLTLENGLAAPPSFSGTRGYLPIEGGRLAAYDLDRGDPAWTVEQTVTSAPAVGDGLVFVAGSDELLALAEDTGTVAWRVASAETTGSPLAWNNGWLVAVTSSGELLALRASDGHLIWKRALGAPLSAPPSLAGDRIYAPVKDGRLIALLLESGEPIWERRLGGAPGEPLAIDTRVYVGSVDNFFYCLSSENGTPLWRWRTGADVLGRPAADARRVYFVSLDNVLRAMDQRSGAQVWRRALPFRPTGGPSMVHNVLILSGLSPGLRVFAIDSGNPAGDIEAAGTVAARPHLLDHTLLPSIVVATTSAQGAEVRRLERRIEPQIVPVAPLPNVVKSF